MTKNWPKLRSFWGCGAFSSKTRIVQGKLGQTGHPAPCHCSASTAILMDHLLFRGRKDKEFILGVLSVTEVKQRAWFSGL